MTAILRSSMSALRAGTRFLKALTVIFVFYLMHVVVMPHLKIAGSMPNLLMVSIAVMTVSYGKLYAFIAGAVTGILMDAMAMTIPLFYLLIYPVLALLCAQIFADMSDIKREMRRIRLAQRKSEDASGIQAPGRRFRFRIRIRRESPQDLDPHLRITLNAVALVLLYEGVMMAYIALGGIRIGFGHLLRALYVTLYTALCSLTMFPARAFLGLYAAGRQRRTAAKREEIGTDRDLLRSMAMVPDDAPKPDGKQRKAWWFGKRSGKTMADSPSDQEHEDSGGRKA